MTAVRSPHCRRLSWHALSSKYGPVSDGVKNVSVMWTYVGLVVCACSRRLAHNVVQEILAAALKVWVVEYLDQTSAGHNASSRLRYPLEAWIGSLNQCSQLQHWSSQRTVEVELTHEGSVVVVLEEERQYVTGKGLCVGHPACRGDLCW